MQTVRFKVYNLKSKICKQLTNKSVFNQMIATGIQFRYNNQVNLIQTNRINRFKLQRMKINVCNNRL